MSVSNRILMLSTHGYVSARAPLGRPDTGGQVVYVLELAKHLAQIGYQVDIGTRRFEDQPPEEIVEERVRILRFPCGGAEFRPKETMCDIIPEFRDHAIEFIRREKLEYSLINSHYWDAGLAGMTLSRELHTPHAHTPHSLGAWKRDQMGATTRGQSDTYNMRRRLHDEREIYAAADWVIATTREQRRLLWGNDYGVAPEKIRLIPPGYDDRRFFPVSSAARQSIKRRLELPQRMILALGRMADNKGYDLLIRALPTVLARTPNATLALALGADNPPPEEMSLIAKLIELINELGVGRHVRFLSHIPDDELADHYRAADVFALCSRYEPFGMTAIEAMACGTPTVVTTRGGLWEELKFGADALFANPLDPVAFGVTIATALQYPAVARRMSEHGAILARSRFSWASVAQRLSDSLASPGPRFQRHGSQDELDGSTRRSQRRRPARLEG